MLKAANPRDASLDAHAEPTMRHAAVTAQVEVPLERFLRKVVVADALLEKREVVLALAAADDLAVAFGRETSTHSALSGCCGSAFM